MLQHAGLLASTANQRDDSLNNRRYWQVAAVGETPTSLLNNKGQHYIRGRPPFE